MAFSGGHEGMGKQLDEHRVVRVVNPSIGDAVKILLGLLGVGPQAALQRVGGRPPVSNFTNIADGDWLIIDVLEPIIHQSLTEPAFTTGWRRVTAIADADATAAGFQFATEAVAGTMYYVGHNQNFGNYRSTDADFVTTPATPRLRIGQGHSRRETDDERKDVDFDVYRIRIVDEDGDAVPAADDVATVASSSGRDHDNQGSTPALKVPHKLFLYDLSQTLTFNAGPTPAKGTLGTDGHALQCPDQGRRQHHLQRCVHRSERCPGTG